VSERERPLVVEELRELTVADHPDRRIDAGGGDGVDDRDANLA
jgi:hypothetical protein